MAIRPMRFILEIRGRVEHVEFHEGYLYVFTCCGIYRLDPYNTLLRGTLHA